MFGDKLPHGPPLVVEYVGGYLCGQTRTVDGSPLAVARKVGERVVYDRYRLQQMGPGSFVYRHAGEAE